MNSFSIAQRNRKWILNGLAIATAGGLAAMLFFFSPERYSFYPRCMFHVLTGLDCPGCGGLRAAHHLLHGDLAGAFSFNPLLVGLLPVLGWFSLRWAVREVTGLVWPNPFQRRYWIWVLLGLLVVFFVVRNLPIAR